jgi:hypothetical protein
MGPKSGFDAMVQAATLRETFAELEDYLDRLGEKKYEEKLEEDDKKIDVVPEEARRRGRELIEDDDLDDKHRNLYLLTQGRLPAFFYCGKAMDVPKAIAFARDNGFLEQTVFVLGTGCFKAADAIRATGRPVVLDADLYHRERDPLTGDETVTFAPSVFAEAGIPFALETNPDASYGEKFPWYQAARCVREGIPRETAIAAITTTPAKLLGLGDRLGSIEPGKDADILVLDGDPLEIRTMIEKVYVGGRLAYDLAEDVRMKNLLEGMKPDTGTEEPSAAEAAEKPSEPDSTKDGGEADTKPENQGDKSSEE